MIVLIIVISILVLLVLPLFVSCRVYLNIKRNLGVIELALFGFSITCFQIEVNKTAINIIRRKGKDKQIQLSLIDEQAIFAEHFTATIFRYIKINEISLFFEVGKKDDACTSSLINGVFLNLMYSFYAMLFTLKKDFRAYISADTKTDTNELKLSTYLNILVTPLMFVISYIRAKLRTKRTVKVYERFKNRQYNN